MDYRARADELYQSFERLCAIEQSLVPQSGPVRFLRTVIGGTAAMLCLPHNLAHPDRRIGVHEFIPGRDDQNFDLLLLFIFRTFLTSTHIWCEQGIIEFCNQQGIQVRCSLTRKWDAVMERIAHYSLSPADMKELVKLRPRDHPSSADIVHASTQDLPSDRRVYWRKHFDALSIVRNKCSHAQFDPELTAGEMKRLAEGSLSEMLSGQRLQLSALIMAPIIEHLIQFFSELEPAPGAVKPAGSGQPAATCR
jgi:hypothetical protein